jgi:Sperm-tail PG-rich repeat
VGPGPGYYSPERAEKLTLIRASEYSFKEQTGRKDLVSDSNVGPGSYQNQKHFLDSAGNFTIGVRRENNISTTLGPGSYSVEKGD